MQGRGVRRLGAAGAGGTQTPGRMDDRTQAARCMSARVRAQPRSGPLSWGGRAMQLKGGGHRPVCWPLTPRAIHADSPREGSLGDPEHKGMQQ